MTVSIGLALLPRGDKGVDGWINVAFAAARMAARLGGNRVDGLVAESAGSIEYERLARRRLGARHAWTSTFPRVPSGPSTAKHRIGHEP